MPDYSSLRQLMGAGFLPQGGPPLYPDFAQQGGSSGTMQPLPPSGGYGGWGRSPDVLDANQLAGVGAGWNPQPRPSVDPGFGRVVPDPAFDAFYEERKAQGMTFPQIMDAWNAQKQPNPNSGMKSPMQPDVMQPWGPGASSSIIASWRNRPRPPGSNVSWNPATGQWDQGDVAGQSDTGALPGSWNTQMPAQQPQQAIYDPYRPWGRR